MQAEAWTILLLSSGLLCFFLTYWIFGGVWGLGRKSLVLRNLGLLPIANPQILERIKDGVVVLDVNNRIVNINTAALTILEKKRDYIGQKLENLFEPSSDMAVSLMNVQSGKWLFQEKTASGSKWLDMTFSPLTDRKNSIQGHIIIFRDVTKQKSAQTRLEAANLALTSRNQELDRHNWEIKKLHEMSIDLQSCPVLEAAYLIINKYIRMLLPVMAGGLYIYSDTLRYMELAVAWGDPSHLAGSFTNNECLGLVRGGLYRAAAGDSNAVCHHVAEEPGRTYICRPLAIDGAPFGVIHCSYPGEAMDQHQFHLAQTVFDGLVLALLNLKMQENLRQESVRDPLTSLFNRRYLEEILPMAFFHAQRTSRPLAIIMVDIDNFKHLNDYLGHRYGDQVLKQVGILLANSIRRNDIACRYGGDEFILVMPDAPLESAYDRAEHIKQEMDTLSADSPNRSEQRLSLSIGVAAFPDHGQTIDELVEAADKALYRAKQGGRNQIRIAG